MSREEKKSQEKPKSYSEIVSVKNNMPISSFVGPLDYEKFDVDDHKGKRRWEFRVAVEPSREKMKKVGEVLAKALEGEYEDINIKWLVLNNPEMPSPESINWDGTKIKFHSKDGSILACDQRGKEICVYMNWRGEEKGYERNPEQFKKLMLIIWKALIDSGIDGVGYTSPATADHEVKAFPGLATPFSYRGYVDQAGRYGFQAIDAWCQQSDPLEGVLITPEDLIKSGISMNHVLDMQRYRIEYLSTHQKSSEKYILSELEILEESVSKLIGPIDLKSVLDELDHLINESKGNIEALRGKLKEETGQLLKSRILRFCPRDVEGIGLNYVDVVFHFNECWVKATRASATLQTVKDLQNMIIHLRYFNDKSIDEKDISKKFCSNKLHSLISDIKNKDYVSEVRGFISQKIGFKGDINKLIDAAPAEMQRIRCNIEFCLRKERALKQEKERLVRMHELPRLIKLKEEIENKQWVLGLFGGETVKTKDNRTIKVPAGVKAIHDLILVAFDEKSMPGGKERPVGVLSKIKELATNSSNYSGHGFFNKRHPITQAFYENLKNMDDDASDAKKEVSGSVIRSEIKM